MLKLTSLRLLERFAAEASVAGAASALELTPSAVLRGLAALEEETGLSLIERTARGVTLNEVGRRYAERAATVLAELERIDEAELDPAALQLLIIDDDPMHLELMTSMLVEAGYRVASCRYAARALEVALDQPPDLAVIDVVLDGADGFEVARRLRSTAELRDAAVLFVSGSSVPETERLARELSGVRHLDKPVVHAQLLAAVASQLRERRMALELRRNPIGLADERPRGTAPPAPATTDAATTPPGAAPDQARLLAATLAAVSELVWVREVGGALIGASPALAALVGADGELPGAALPAGALAEQLDAWHAACLDGQDPLVWSGEVVAADGRTHHLDVRVAQVRGTAGTPIGVVGTARAADTATG